MKIVMYKQLSDFLSWIGIKDFQGQYFENWYPTSGMHYHSYLLKDQKTALLDTVDAKFLGDYLDALERNLAGRKLDYLIISHMEPDHAGCIEALFKKYPELKLVGNHKTRTLIEQFFHLDVNDRYVNVNDRDHLNLGVNHLVFYFAPMVHWPEVMLTYCPEQQILFSADAFGSFGAYTELYLDEVSNFDDYLANMRRYYANIVGKYGSFVQKLLKNLAPLPIRFVYPLHGLFIRANLPQIIDYYQKWSQYLPEEIGTLILYGSIYGNTEKAVKQLALHLEGRKKIVNLTQLHPSYPLAEAFRYSHLVLAAPTYNNGLFDVMENLLATFVQHGLQKRTFALIENGSWAPRANLLMQQWLAKLEQITVLPHPISIRSSLSSDNLLSLKQLAAEIQKSMEVI